MDQVICDPASRLKAQAVDSSPVTKAVQDVMNVIGMDGILPARGGSGGPHPTHRNPGVRQIPDLVVLNHRVCHQSTPDPYGAMKLLTAVLDKCMAYPVAPRDFFLD